MRSMVDRLAQQSRRSTHDCWLCRLRKRVRCAQAIAEHVVEATGQAHHLKTEPTQRRPSHSLTSRLGGRGFQQGGLRLPIQSRPSDERMVVCSLR